MVPGEGFQVVPVVVARSVAHQADVRDAELPPEGDGSRGCEERLHLRIGHHEQQISMAKGAAGPRQVLESRLHVCDDDRLGELGLDVLQDVTYRDVGYPRSTASGLLDSGPEHEGDAVGSGQPVLGQKLRWLERWNLPAATRLVEQGSHGSHLLFGDPTVGGEVGIGVTVDGDDVVAGAGE